MSRDETRELLGEVHILYPSFGRHSTDDELRRTVDAWARVLGTLDAEAVREGLYRYARENRFPPSVAEVVAEARRWLSDKTDPMQNPHLRRRRLLARNNQCQPEKEKA